MTATDGSDPAPNVWRLVVVWWVLSVIGVLLMIFVVGPHIPPGSATSQAHEQHRAFVAHGRSHVVGVSSGPAYLR